MNRLYLTILHELGHALALDDLAVSDGIMSDNYMPRMGIVHPRVGDGAYFDERPEAILRHPVESLMLLNQIPVADVFEARLQVEPSGAACAAERATVRDLAAMEQTIERLRAAQE